jgi:HSP20 family protein
LPHFDEKDINIQVDNNALVISAERHETEEDKDKKYVVRESSSSFYRRIALPERADTDKIQAELHDGVLKINVPLTSLPEPKKIALSTRKK